MPDARKAPTGPSLDYDPEVRDRIHELVERMRGTDNAQEIRRLEDELDRIIFGSHWMPKIKWESLPQEVRRHLYQRARERQVSVDDLARLEHWRQSNPDVPDGWWVADFGTFMLAGEGPYPKTFPLRRYAARSQRIE
jgi:hypothetical protein